MTELSPLAFSVYRSTMPFSIANFESVQSHFLPFGSSTGNAPESWRLRLPGGHEVAERTTSPTQAIYP